MGLKWRYGRKHNYSLLSNEQKRFLLDQRVSEFEDKLSKRTVRIEDITAEGLDTPNGEIGWVDLKLFDEYSFKERSDGILLPDYAFDRLNVYNEVLGMRPLEIGSDMQRYQLGKDPKKNVDFNIIIKYKVREIKEKSKKLKR